MRLGIASKWETKTRASFALFTAIVAIAVPMRSCARNKRVMPAAVRRPKRYCVTLGACGVMDTTFEDVQPGNYLVTKLADGTLRIWHVDCAEAYFIDGDFNRLNAEASPDPLIAGREVSLTLPPGWVAPVPDTVTSRMADAEYRVDEPPTVVVCRCGRDFIPDENPILFLGSPMCEACWDTLGDE